MKHSKSFGWSAALFLLGALPLAAQENNAVEQLRRQLQEMRENFERAQQQQRLQIEALQQQLEALQKVPPPAAAPPQPAPAAPVAAPPPPETKPWSPAQPLTVGRAGSSYMNISFETLLDFGWATTPNVTMLERGDHDPIQRGFSLRNAEISLDGAVDPYFKGFGNIVLKLDHNNDTEIELEEAYLLSTSLPGNLQLKGGQFFAEFGRQNPQHPHSWAFVDQPLIMNRAFGPEGLRNPGARLSWLVPTPFYSELFLGVFNGNGSVAANFRYAGEPDASGVNRVHGRATLDRQLRGPGDLLFVPRLASSFELNDTQTLVVGASAAFGPNNTGPQERTEIYGVDAYWKWKPTHAHEGFPFVSWQTEALFRRFGAGADPSASTPLPAERLDDWGFYSQVLWGFHPHWVAGLRGDYVTGNHGAFDAQDPDRAGRTRISPNLTWYPSEFSKIRLQYNYDHGQEFGVEHGVWMQFEFLLGAHAAHKF